MLDQDAGAVTQIGLQLHGLYVGTAPAGAQHRQQQVLLADIGSALQAGLVAVGLEGQAI